MIVSPITSSALTSTVTATSAVFSATMIAKSFYQFVSNTACWIKQGTAPTAVVNTAGNVFVPANTLVILDGGNGVDLAVIRDAADGRASLTGCKTY